MTPISRPEDSSDLSVRTICAMLAQYLLWNFAFVGSQRVVNRRYHQIRDPRKALVGERVGDDGKRTDDAPHCSGRQDRLNSGTKRLYVNAESDLLDSAPEIPSRLG